MVLCLPASIQIHMLGNQQMSINLPLHQSEPFTLSKLPGQNLKTRPLENDIVSMIWMAAIKVQLGVVASQLILMIWNPR